MNTMKNIYEKIKTKIIEVRNSILLSLIEKLNYWIAQLTQSGIRSTQAKYIYRPMDKKYISNLVDYDYPDFTENVENAVDFSEMPFQKFILWRLNLGLKDYEQFYYKIFIKLNGGNFGSTAPSIFVGESNELNKDGSIENDGKSLAEMDQLGMDEI